MNQKDINNIETIAEVVHPDFYKEGVYDNFSNDKDTLFIVKNVEKHTGVSAEVFCTTSRKRNIVFPRQICMYFLYKYTNHSQDDVASFFRSEVFFNNTVKNHATVVHANKTIKNLIETNKSVRALCDNITEDIMLFQNEALRSGGSHKIAIFSKIIRKFYTNETEVQELLTKYINAK